MTDFVTACNQDLQAKLEEVASFRDSIVTVFSESDFRVKAKMLKTPFAGIMYGGLRRASGDLTGKGFAGELNMAVLVGVSTDTDSWGLLTKIRRKVLGSKSATGHTWRFKSESYIGDNNGISYFIQMWDTWCPVVADQ